MKKFILLAAVLCFSLSSFAQNREFIYAEIVGTGKLLSNKVTVEIDFGQSTSVFESSRLRGEDGKPIKFNSMVDAMNWMGNDGWEFAQAYVITTGQNNVYHWLLKKDISSLTEEERNEVTSQFNTSKK